MWPFKTKPIASAAPTPAVPPAPTSISSPTCIAHRPLLLAHHLRRVADALDAKLIIYDWCNCAACNCGLLVRSLTGWSVNDLHMNKPRGIWEQVARTHTDACFFNPGATVPEFFVKMKSLGMEPMDFEHVENLSHPELMGATSTKGCIPRRADPTNVSAYFRRWATLIEAFNAKHLVAAPIVPCHAPEIHEPTEVELEHVELRPLS